MSEIFGEEESKVSSSRQLAEVYLLKMKGKDVNEMWEVLSKKGQEGEENFVSIYESSEIPEYALNEKGECITLDKLPDVCEEDKDYIFFNFHPISNLLEEEVSAIGVEEVLQGMDLFSVFRHLYCVEWKNEKQMNVIPPNNFVVIEVSYHTYHTLDGNETDVEYELVGYLDEDFDLLAYDQSFINNRGRY